MIKKIPDRRLIKRELFAILMDMPYYKLVNNAILKLYYREFVWNALEEITLRYNANNFIFKILSICVFYMQTKIREYQIQIRD